MKTSRLITAFLVTCTPLVFGMELNRASALYFNNCKVADEKNDQKMYQFLQEACEVSLDLARQRIEGKRSYFEQKLMKKYNDLLFTDKKRGEFDAVSWQKGVKWAKQLDDFRKAAKPVIFNTVVHDETMPALFITLLKKEMVLNGLHPCMFNIIEDKEIVGFWTRTYNVDFNINSYNLTNMKITEPGFIKINREVLLKLYESYEQTEAFCAHVISSLVAHKNHPCDFFKMDLTDEEANEYDTFRQNGMHLLVLLYALKNQRMARLLQIYHQYYFDSENAIVPQEKFHDNIQYYEELCKINRYHKILAWLKEYSDISRVSC